MHKQHCSIEVYHNGTMAFFDFTHQPKSVTWRATLQLNEVPACTGAQAVHANAVDTLCRHCQDDEHTQGFDKVTCTTQPTHCSTAAEKASVPVYTMFEQSGLWSLWYIDLRIQAALPAPTLSLPQADVQTLGGFAKNKFPGVLKHHCLVLDTQLGAVSKPREAVLVERSGMC